jgi:cytochrome c553
MTRAAPITRPLLRLARTGVWLAVAACVALNGRPAAAFDLEYGRYLASECVTCHQASGQTDGIPSIVGWPEDHFVAVLQEYQAGVRDHDVMRTISRRYTTDDLAALAAYFHSLADAPAAP